MMHGIESWGAAIVAVTAICAGIVAVFLLAIILRSRDTKRPPNQDSARAGRIQLRHSVVMLHGILGFDRVGLRGFGQAYFRGIGGHLKSHGVQVSFPTVPMVGSIEARARALARQVQARSDGPVVVVAHSMGGLDTRHAIHALGLAPHVAALVTIGTPHRGTAVADLGTRTFPRLVRWGLRRLGLDTPAIDGLTRASAARFNDQTPDHPQVQYYSVVASARWRILFFNPALWLTALYLRVREGANDGLVSAASQRWGSVLFETNADHWSQIGWTIRFDARPLYERILRELEDRGF